MIASSTAAVSAQGASLQSGPAMQMGKDVFLKLLIAELRSQDPMRPMEDKEFIAQLAQFSTLEEMQSMNTSLELFIRSQTASQALDFIGRTVKWLEPGSTEEKTGLVDSVDFSSGWPVLMVGDKKVPLAYVSSVS